MTANFNMVAGKTLISLNMMLGIIQHIALGRRISTYGTYSICMMSFNFISRECQLVLLTTVAQTPYTWVLGIANDGDKIAKVESAARNADAEV